MSTTPDPLDPWADRRAEWDADAEDRATLAAEAAAAKATRRPTGPGSIRTYAFPASH